MTIVNVNVGLLGHVDSGKTSLAKALSSIKSTACFDKHPQSQERGITIDLGFSSFSLGLVESFCEQGIEEDVQVTLVDCPGHASLIRKIIGGAQIIDFMLLVIDVNKGIQTQTAECLVIAELLNKNLLIVLNKIDLLSDEKRVPMIEKVEKKIRWGLKGTRYHLAPMVAISANPKNADSPEGIVELIDALKKMITVPKRELEKPMVLAVDHCFSIKGKGTILTGTVIQGRLSVNSTVEIPHLKISKKVKSIQMFKKDVPTASAGDRVGVGVTHFDSKLLETGVASEPGYFGMTYAVIVDVRKVMYFKFKISSGSKYHISVGHDTVIGKVTLFKAIGNERLDEFSLDKHYEYVEELVSPAQDGDQLESTMALLELEQEIPTVEGDLFIASKLDVDINKPCCRIAFHGHILKRTVDKNYADTFLPKLSIYKWKEKEGLIDRVVNNREIIVTSLFKKETQMHPFLNLRVRLTTGENGVIKSTFGAGGKVKVELDTDLNEETKQRFTKKTRQNDSAPKEIVKVQLKFKKYLYNSNKTVKQ